MELDAGIAIGIGGVVEEKLQPIHKRLAQPSSPKPIRRRFGASLTQLAANNTLMNIGAFPICTSGRMWVIRKIAIFGADGHTQLLGPLPFAPNQITLGTSGTANFNNNSTGVLEQVSGGTVSAIAINGVTTGSTSGTFFIPAGGTITVTYTVAPTTFLTFQTTATPATADIYAGSTQDENTVDFQGIILSGVTIPTIKDFGNRHLTLYAQDQVYAIVSGVQQGQTVTLTGEADEYRLDDVEEVTIKARPVQPQ